MRRNILCDKNRKYLGSWGEKQAAEYLKQRGYYVLERNLRFKNGEIDIIACKKDSLVIVEVKTSKYLGFAFENFSRRKILQVKKVFQSNIYYFFNNYSKYSTFRFDCIVIIAKEGKKNNVFHYKNI